MLGNPAVPNCFVGILDAWHNPQVGGQLVLICKILDIADHTEQDRSRFLSNPFNAADVLVALEFFAVLDDIIVQTLNIFR